MSHSSTFQPFPFLSNQHLQTFIGPRLRFVHVPPSRTDIITLPDGDRIALEVSTPPTWQARERTVILIHGLCSSHRAHSLIRMAHQLWQRGLRVVRMNMRGCGSGVGLARQMYHGGSSEDILSVLTALHKATPETTFAVIGYSLGGNQILKLAGELGCSVPKYLAQVIAVCPPADLIGCAKLLALPKNRFYDQHFAKNAKAGALERHRLFPDLPAATFPEKLSLYNFDDVYTAPQNGFENAEDYYARCSAAPLVEAITIPCQILFADDDPFIDGTALKHKRLPSNVEVLYTTNGGHVGFLGTPRGSGSLHWLDWRLLRWLELS